MDLAVWDNAGLCDWLDLGGDEWQSNASCLLHICKLFAEGLLRVQRWQYDLEENGCMEIWEVGRKGQVLSCDEWVGG